MRFRGVPSQSPLRPFLTRSSDYCTMQLLYRGCIQDTHRGMQDPCVDGVDRWHKRSDGGTETRQRGGGARG